MKMQGWKTWVAGVGAIAGGVVRVAQGILSEPLNAQEVWEGFGAMVAGFGIIGIGHKVEKSGKK